eukprot:m.228618 g.228618  ORF g.228618 m.228618 type:complete len:56 (-) comp25979_c0_seq3:133-300(-)
MMRLTAEPPRSTPTSNSAYEPGQDEHRTHVCSEARRRLPGVQLEDKIVQIEYTLM